MLKAEDVDTIMKDGLGMRYAWMGPLETAVLNANGKLISISLYLFAEDPEKPPPSADPEMTAVVFVQSRIV